MSSRIPPFEKGETVDYVVFKENGVIKAKNGEDGSIDFSDTDASTVIQDTIDALSSGGAIYLKQPASPYLLTDWIDIDTDSIHIIGEARFAEDGQPLLKVADGANVGGIRIGYNSHTEYVVVEKIGVHGNTDNQTKGYRHHGFLIDDTTHIIIKDCYATRTHPYHVHGTGGSGITVRHTASHILIEGCHLYDVGDRSIQVGGSYVTVKNCFCEQGFDRGISLDAEEGTFTDTATTHYLTQHGLITNNVMGVMSDGAGIKFAGSAHSDAPADENAEYITVANNICYSDGTEPGIGFWKMTDLENNLLAANNLIRNVSKGVQVCVDSGKQNVDNVAVVGNVIQTVNRAPGQSFTGWGIETTRVKGVIIANNTIANTDKNGIWLNITDNALVVNNLILNPGLYADNSYAGIRFRTDGTSYSQDNIIGGNIIRVYSSTQPDYGIKSDDANNTGNIIKNNEFFGTFGSGYIQLQGNELDLLGQGKAFSFESQHTSYADGLSNEELDRIALQAGQRLQVYKVEAQLKGGGTNADVTLEVYDDTAGSTIDSTTAGSVSTAGGISGKGNTILIRISNASGVAQDVSFHIEGVIAEVG